MKHFIFFICFVYTGSRAVCQVNDSVPKMPFVIHTDKQQTHEQVVRNLSNYTYLAGKKFGSFDVKDFEGKSITNKNFKNKIVLYNFWFEGCKYCHNLFEPLNELFKYYQNEVDFQIVSFTFDTPDVVIKNINKYQLIYPVISTTNKACYDLMFDKGFPANFLVDQNGIIVFGMGVSPLLNNNSFFKDDLIPKINVLLANLKKAK